MNRTSRGSRAVRIEAMSPFRSSAGPATQRMPTPSSSRTMYARLVLPSPGGPTSRHVIERLRPRTRCLERDVELLLDPVLSDEIVEVSGPQRALELVLLGPESRSEELLGHAAFSAWRTRSSGGASGIGAGERAFRLDGRVAELDERVPRHEVGRALGHDLLEPHLLLQLEDDALSGLLPHSGDGQEARGVAEDDRAPQLRRRRAGDDRAARPSGRLRTPTAAARRAGARPAPRTRTAGARPRARGGTCRT